MDNDTLLIEHLTYIRNVLELDIANQYDVKYCKNINSTIAVYKKPLHSKPSNKEYNYFVAYLCMSTFDYDKILFKDTKFLDNYNITYQHRGDDYSIIGIDSISEWDIDLDKIPNDSLQISNLFNRMESVADHIHHIKIGG